MVTRESPDTLPFVYRANNQRDQRLVMLVLAGLLTILVAVFGVLGYVELVRAGHWLRLVVPTLMLFVWWLGLKLLIRSYRQGTAVWLVDSDGVERWIGEHSDSAEFDQLSRLALRPKGAIMQARNGPLLSLPQPATQALRRTQIVETLAAAIEPTLKSQGHWSVRGYGFLGLLRIVTGLVLLGASLFHMWHAGHAIAMIANGRRFFGRSLIVTQAGIKRRAADFATVPWSDIESLHTDADGLTIRAACDQKFRVSVYADNVLPLVAYLNAKLSARGLDAPLEPLWEQID